jgi:streptogramin lyase
MINGVASNSQACPAGTFGASGGGHPHCVVLGNDGNVYACDRPNSRIQVQPSLRSQAWKSASL